MTTTYRDTDADVKKQLATCVARRPDPDDPGKHHVLCVWGRDQDGIPISWTGWTYDVPAGTFSHRDTFLSVTDAFDWFKKMTT